MSERLYTVAATPFEAARRVDILPGGHRARRLHGHSFLARVRAKLPLEWAPFPGGETDGLTDRLRAVVAPLDYALLNDHLPVPTDENLARWIRARLAVPGLDQIGIQSTHNRGVDLDTDEHAHVWRRFRFEAAHRLPNVPAGPKCGRMHGHGFEVILHADQDLGGRPLGVDYDHIDALWASIHAELDHACLNDIPGLENPTSENIAAWIWKRLRPKLPLLTEVVVAETCTARAVYRGE